MMNFRIEFLSLINTQNNFIAINEPIEHLMQMIWR
jgi:hypothetical protein